MRTQSILTLALASFAVAQDAAQAPATSTPGKCMTKKGSPDPCITQFGEGYSCVAVQSNTEGMETLAQCVFGTPCAGNQNGLCPTFSSWSKKYRQVQPICAFTPVDNCNDPTDAKGNSLVKDVKTTTNNTVSCFQTTFSDNNGNSKKVNGIYKCVDSTIYEQKGYGYVGNLTQTQLQSCAGNSTLNNGDISFGLCNNHGTCAPKNQFSPSYGCMCNKGFDASDNCQVAKSNVCDAIRSCGSQGTCNKSTGECECKTGTTGNQCSKCDPTVTDAQVICNGQGTCGDSGACTCKEGYTGTLCELTAPKPKKSVSNSTITKPDTTNSASSIGFATTSAVVAIALAVFA